MAKFEVFADFSKNWRWRLIADNGAKIVTSGESFASKSNAIRAARRVKQLAPNATVPPDPTTSPVLRLGSKR